MKVAIYSAHLFELEHLKKSNMGRHQLKMIPTYLAPDTAILAKGCTAVAIFANDDATTPVLEQLYQYGVRYLALRSAGYNHVDLEAATRLGISVAHVPEYSPYAVAEHAVTLMLALNRKLINAHQRVRELNFSLNGLTGFDMHGKTVGIIGTGRIGSVVARILHGFGCQILAFDLQSKTELEEHYGIHYTGIDELCGNADIITLHVPLTDSTHYLINANRLKQMKQGVMLINTSRGALIDTRAVIQALKTGRIGYLGLDVYEEEKGLFFEDHSAGILQDDVIARLLTFSNVLITSHQGFLTTTALRNISETTIENLTDWEEQRINNRMLNVVNHLPNS